MPLIATQHASGVKKVVCTHCGRLSDASKRAMSVFCPHCHKRVILENYRIRSYHGVIEFATCGDIIVERNGFVVAPIKVHDLTVKGRVQGRVTARGRVTVCKTGQLRGDVEAPLLTVEDGARINGFLRIGLSPPV
jgi:hypothetical protein